MASTTEALILGVAVALLVIYASRLLWRRQCKLYGNLPPGPRALPILGSLHLLGTHPHRSLAELASQYGPLMSVWLGQRLCIVASSPEVAKEFLKFQDANFAFRPSTRAAEIIVPGGVHSLPQTPHFVEGNQELERGQASSCKVTTLNFDHFLEPHSLDSCLKCTSIIYKSLWSVALNPIFSTLKIHSLFTGCPKNVF